MKAGRRDGYMEYHHSAAPVLHFLNHTPCQFKEFRPRNTLIGIICVIFSNLRYQVCRHCI